VVSTEIPKKERPPRNRACARSPARIILGGGCRGLLHEERHGVHRWVGERQDDLGFRLPIDIRVLRLNSIVLKRRILRALILNGLI